MRVIIIIVFNSLREHDARITNKPEKGRGLNKKRKGGALIYGPN